MGGDEAPIIPTDCVRGARKSNVSRFVIQAMRLPATVTVSDPMRGVVLLVDPDGAIDPTPLREAGLLVYETADERVALERLSDVTPDALVVGQTVALTELRRHVDHATSIIVVGGNENPPERLRTTGADAFLPPSADLLYEIHRALILRRSGRRLPWNW